jgi:hypothetical protein
MPNKKILINKLQERFGREVRFSYECEELSNHIFECIRIRVSAQTLRRLFGYIKDEVKTSNRILNYLASYCGFEDYNSLINSKNTSLDTKNINQIAETIKQFYAIQHTNVNDINYQRACGNIARMITSNEALFNKLSGYLSKNTVSQIYFFERYPLVGNLSDEYLIHLKRYIQAKNTNEAQLFGNCLFFLSYYLRQKNNELNKYLKKINSIEITDDIHYFPRARKMMSNILYAYLNKDQVILKKLIALSFEEEKKLNKNKNNNNIFFPFYHYIMVDCFILIRDYESAMRVFKIAELDYKSYNDGSIEQGYYEHFDLMKAITYYNLGDEKSAKRILNRLDSSAVFFTFQDYHNLIRKILEYNMSGNESAKKRPILKKEIESLIKRTGYTIFKEFIKE